MIGKINQIETMGLVDGPGIRVVIFMQGCILRCNYCHNPEMWDINLGKEVTPDEILHTILKYKNFFGNEGGVTFSGGEPLMQSEFLLECLKLCKKNNINTCIDTSGVGIVSYYDEILKYTDLVIYDVKATEKEKYKEITKHCMEETVKFLKYCMKNNTKLWIRQVIIPGINDNIENIEKLAEFIKCLKNVERVELLPYHILGTKKYEQLNIEYKLKNIKSMNNEKCKELEKKLIDLLS